MSLHRRNGAYNRNGARPLAIAVVACLLCAVFCMAGISFARYFANWSGSINTDIAQWNIKVNNVSLSDNADIPIKFYYENGDTAIESDMSNPIRPGQSGYFDVELDPDGTEVSFSYRITLDTRSLPETMSITQYSRDLGATKETLPADGCLKDTLLLNDAAESSVKFTSANKLTVRYYWVWADAPFNETLNYSVSVRVFVEQFLGETASVAGAEGETA